MGYGLILTIGMAVSAALVLFVTDATPRTKIIILLAGVIIYFLPRLVPVSYLLTGPLKALYAIFNILYYRYRMMIH